MAKLIICKDCGEEKEHEAHGLCRRCYRKKWDVENKERVLEHARKYRNENPNSRVVRMNWRTQNPDYFRMWKKRNPEAVRIYKQRRRARVNDLPFTLTGQDWQEILDCWDYRCAYCGKHDFNLQQEHVTPICQDGGYTIENIVPACRGCNEKKGGRTPIEAGMSFYYQNVY